MAMYVEVSFLYRLCGIDDAITNEVKAAKVARKGTPCAIRILKAMSIDEEVP